MKILVTGLGSIGQRHVCNLKRLYGNNVEISAYRVRGRDLVLDDLMVEKYGRQPEDIYNLKTYTNLGKALEDRPNAVLVTNPNNLHIPTALIAAEHGCNLFIDKPLSNSLAGVSELQRIVTKKNLVVFVGYQLRFHPALKLIKKMIEDQSIGKIVSGSFHFGEHLPGQHPYEDYRNEYAARSELGGGVILCLIHEIDLAYWFFGTPKKVFAVGGQLSDLEIDVEDTASILLQYDIDGREVPIHIHLDFVQKPPKRECHIVGSKGKISWDYMTKELRLFKSGDKEWQVFDFNGFNRNHEFLDEMQHFVECIQRHETPVVSLQDGVESLGIALAAKSSLSTGAPTYL